MKIFSASQTREIDTATIASIGGDPLLLMERAAAAFVTVLLRRFPVPARFVCVCGKGNNGGDGFAIARLLKDKGLDAAAAFINYEGTVSPSCAANKARFAAIYSDSLHEINDHDDLKTCITGSRVIIDALLGAGTSRPCEGLIADVIRLVNDTEMTVVSVDLPSGLPGDSPASGPVIRSTLVITFQFPKLSLLMPDNAAYAPEFEIVDIGLSESALNEKITPFYYTTRDTIVSLLSDRKKFSHKGSFGHALLLAGSAGKSGAALLAAEACLRSGAGLLTVHSPKETLDALVSRLPEAMTSQDESDVHITTLPKTEKYAAIGAGPGIGTEDETQTVIKKLLQYYAGKLVLDADALNILSLNKTWLSFLPPSAILTPHVGELERLTGKAADGYERLESARQLAVRNKVIVILKGAHTAVCMPDATIFFNSTGNAGLAKGGSGDVLTGMITGLLARGYNAPKAALIGTFVHGWCGDLCAENLGMESMLPADVIKVLPSVVKQLYDAR